MAAKKIYVVQLRSAHGEVLGRYAYPTVQQADHYGELMRTEFMKTIGVVYDPETSPIDPCIVDVHELELLDAGMAAPVSVPKPMEVLE